MPRTARSLITILSKGGGGGGGAVSKVRTDREETAHARRACVGRRKEGADKFRANKKPARILARLTYHTCPRPGRPPRVAALPADLGRHGERNRRGAQPRLAKQQPDRLEAQLQEQQQRQRQLMACQERRRCRIGRRPLAWEQHEVLPRSMTRVDDGRRSSSTRRAMPPTLRHRQGSRWCRKSI